MHGHQPPKKAAIEKGREAIYGKEDGFMQVGIANTALDDWSCVMTKTHSSGEMHQGG